MEKGIFLTGLIILIIATLLFSFLKSINSIYFVLLGLVGLIIAIFGLRNKKVEGLLLDKTYKS